jgi:hypothetical protein
VCLTAAAKSALPVVRPWEYFNELIGGSKNAYLYFNDEGVDVGQRSKERAASYHQVLEPLADKPFVEIYNNKTELTARGVKTRGTTTASPCIWPLRQRLQPMPDFLTRQHSGTTSPFATTHQAPVLVTADLSRPM